jgi:hypothetical protein
MQKFGKPIVEDKTMNKKYFWKVIRIDGRKSSHTDGKGMEVTYPIDRWAKPKIKGSKLFCFPSRKDANDFLRACPEPSLLKAVTCLCKNPTPINEDEDLCMNYDTLSDLVRYWEGDRAGLFLFKAGTPIMFWADAIKCLE